MGVIEKKQILKEMILKNQIKPLKFGGVEYKFKDTQTILKNVYNSNKEYKKNIYTRGKIRLILQKVFPKNLLNFISYYYYKNRVLIIATKNHLGQYELNYKKIVLLNIFKQFDEFKDIKQVSIKRDEKFSQNFKFEIYKPKKLIEKSYAIFDNVLSNQRLYKKFEKIREVIKKGKR